MNKSPSDRLAEILAQKEVELQRLTPHESALRSLALRRNDFRPFRNTLFQPGSTTIIAEVKKASPSAGVLMENFNPVDQAREYERGGASALSILTDERFFQGHLNYLKDVRQQVELPILRKDFIISELQVYETVIAGADAILLIVAALEDEQMRRLFELSKTFQLDVLVEVHDMAEMDRALDLGADIIGINNRNLKTFEVDLGTTEALAPEIPNDCLGITESGIRRVEDVRFCREQGIDCFLIGETLMRSGQPAEVLREFLAG
ncbi:MAG: indole-3-glycerol phosphate synthase TrpC [Blastochloris sp.]|nr:indole-3-glycerol phosphate synthase TrpC [Blastochloris sp.]